jgi:flagellar biosynthesis protein FlhF
MALEDSLRTENLPSDVDVTAEMLADQLSTRIRVDTSLGWDSSQAKAIMLVGPAGSGKTTALLKLALEYGIRRGRSVELWTLDPQSRELDQATQSFSKLLGIPSRTFKSPNVLAAALAESDLTDLMVLIDTRGFGGESLEADQELSVMVSGSVPIDCQLVLSAAWHPSALSRVVDRFEVFQPSRLLFTMLDQASTFGALLQEPWRTRKPLSFLGDGVLGAGKMQPANLTFILDKLDQATGQ